MTRFIAIAFIILICNGCAPKQTYHWGGYEDNLNTYYKSPKSPEDHQHYMESLFKIIEESTANGMVVPPGIYADYGYGLYQIKNYQEAIQYFEKEKALWPEATPLMERLIGNTRALMKEKRDTT